MSDTDGAEERNAALRQCTRDLRKARRTGRWLHVWFAFLVVALLADVVAVFSTPTDVAGWAGLVLAGATLAVLALRVLPGNDRRVAEATLAAARAQAAFDEANAHTEDTR